MPLAVGVYFGTGRHDQSSDITTVAGNAQAIYGIFDPVDTASDAFSNALTNQTTANLQNQSVSSFSVRRSSSNGHYYVPTGRSGFYINLATSITVSNDFINPVGEVVNPPINVRGEVLFTTFLPDTGSCDIGGFSFLQAVHFQTGGGAVVDFHQDPDEPFYNGGIPDLTGEGNYNTSDLSQGIAEKELEPVLDANVSAIDLTDDVTPYEHDGELTHADVRLHSTNGGIVPSVSSIGHTGLAGSPSVLVGAKKVVIQDAYPSDPSNPDGSGGGGDGSDDIGATDQMPPPKLVPMNIYNLPLKVLSYHEVTGQ
jgi:hypothetical protein